MNLLQALFYFLREASLNMLRGWKVTLLVATTIAVSLFVGGIFLLFAGGVARSVESWRSEAKVVLYLEPELTAAEVRALSLEVGKADWVVSADLIGAAEARRRFETAFPGLAGLLGSEDPLPPSLEFGLDESRIESAAFRDWMAGLAVRPEVSMVDDDRQWLRQVDLFATLLRTVGLGLGGLLLFAAVLTTASVIRLTAHVYRQEIKVLRLVGGTAFFIRGPFVVEGGLQGLLGGSMAALALFAGERLLHWQGPHLLSSGVMAPSPPSPIELLWLVALGGAAGLVGALLSLRRQRLGRESGL